MIGNGNLSVSLILLKLSICLGKNNAKTYNV